MDKTGRLFDNNLLLNPVELTLIDVKYSNF